MKHSINPEKHELERARERIEQVLETYSYSFDVEEIEFDLGWQRIEKDVSLVSTLEKQVILVLNPEGEMDGLEKNVLRGIFEIEFLKKAGYDSLEFDWQEVAKFAYVKNKVKQVLGEKEKRKEELEQKWPELRKELDQETEEFQEELYMNAAALGELIGEKLLEERGLDEIPGITKSDIIEAGDELFD